MKLKIFPKVFLFTFSMMLIITLFAHCLIFYIAPTQNVLITSNYVTNVGALSYSEVDMQQLITNTILQSFPISFLGCFVISFIFSFLFSKGLTSPILSIAKTVKEMTELNTNAKIKITSTDEIGFLANDINQLYRSLISTIQHLEIEKENVSKAEQEKLDFLRIASHELKTPVTELNATLENMILGIGEYADYDVYLPKCKEVVEQLGKMIKDILSMSRLHLDGANDCEQDISLKKVISEMCELFKLIAETKAIQFAVMLENDISLHISEQLLKKALSNILLNAVNYTEAGKNITVSISGQSLSVINECNPIPPEHLKHIFEPFYRTDYSRNHDTGGNGLGLYIVDTILKKLKLKYRFFPLSTNNGMCFTIQF